MASPVAHTLGAYAALISIEPKLIADPHRNRIAWGTAFVFGNLADADFVVAYFSSQPFLRHHFFSHSIPFALCLTLLALLILKIARRKDALKMALLLGAAYGTHLLLDYFTEDGSAPYGIPLLWPVTDHHFLAPVILFYATHRGGWDALLSVHNTVGILIETAIFLPLLLLAARYARKRSAVQPSQT